MINYEKLPGESARDYAYRWLTQNIVKLEFKPGTMLSENELSRQLGVSRTPLREAMIDLNHAQIVETIPQRGNYVSYIDPDLIEEARFIRRSLDLSVVELACQIATPEDIINLEANLKLQEFYLDHFVADKMMELDDTFHRLIYVSAKKERTYKMKANMMIHFDRVRVLALVTVKDSKIVSDHRQILEAIRNRDVEQARAVTSKHLDRYDMDKEQMIKAYPEYFKA
ncbi:MAG: GntR family transcriptional regulator [Clostridiales bacterium]|nr:GntR family transcriptional regulator [Clostridiales bacterium]